MFYEFGGRCAFKTLLDASPVLEELILSGVNWEHWKWSRVVASLSLKRLTIIRRKWDDYDDSDFKSISFDTPGLVYLEYSDYVPKEYLNVNLNSLVEAKIHLCPQENFVWSEDDATRFHLTNLLHGLKDVEMLNLNSRQTLEMFFVFREALPVFEKLSHLSVNQSNLCWFPLIVLVKNAPNLKTLTIQGALHHRGITTARWGDLCHCVSEYSFLSSCSLQVLKITEYDGSPEDLMQMKYILGNLSCLELVEIHSSVTDKRRKAKLESDLQGLPRASPKCRFAYVL